MKRDEGQAVGEAAPDSGPVPDCVVTVRFHAPPDEMRGYFTTFYCADIDVRNDGLVRDALHPEWANLRFFSGAMQRASIGSDPVVTGASFLATGPSLHPLAFDLPTCRLWGIGLLPLGWARFVGVRANDCADLVADGRRHPAFAQFAEFADTLFGAQLDEAAELSRICDFFRARLRGATADDQRIGVVHDALVDPYSSSVGDLVARTGLTQRTLERVCLRHFGFAPKLLLRRQRFMRSLAQFMLDPSLKWIGALDGHYHDQAQFVRDFHEFMGETPRAYAARPHPVLATFMRERMRVAGSAVQTTDPSAGVAPLAEHR